MEMIFAHLLSLIIFVPLIAAIAICAMPSITGAKMLALSGSGLVFALCCLLWLGFKSDTAGLQFVEQYDWIPQFGVKYIVGVDGLSLLLIMLCALTVPLILISQWHNNERRARGFLSLMLALQTGMMGALVSFDLVLFYVFWEAMLIPMYFLIGIWGGARRIYATTKFVIYTVDGSLFMLLAAIVLYLHHFNEFGYYTTNLLDIYRVTTGGSIQYWLFAAFAIAFAIKIPMFPFHTWLPDAHVEAPTAGSVILAGILLKMGTYGILRFAIPLFPEATAAAAPLILGLGVVGIFYGALMAWVQTDAKKLVAYSSVSHLGFVVLGSVAIIGGRLSEEALTGAVYQMINHGVSTGSLFFLVGIIYERRHTRGISDFGGLAANMPWFAVMLIIATLSSVGLPGTGGFVGEFLILLGTFQANQLVGAIASLGVLLGAIYMLHFVRKILFGPLDNPKNKELKDLSPREFLYLSPFAILAILMGIFPNLFLDKVRPSIQYLAQNYTSYRLSIVEPVDSFIAQRNNLSPEGSRE